MGNVFKSIRQKLNRPIVLVGMMGCGKSHIGAELSLALGVNFYDSDLLIEQEQGKKIVEIFADEGDVFFRTLERQKIKELLERGICVISTGGGAVTTPEVLEDIKRVSLSIWLHSDVDTILERVKPDINRPLLQCDNPRAKLEELLDLRKGLYAQADIHIYNASDDTKSVIKNIEQELTSFL